MPGETTQNRAEALVLGEATEVGGFSLRVFDVRSENVPEYDEGEPPKDWPESVSVFVPRPGYGPVYPIASGEGYTAVAVDLVLENPSPSPVAVLVQANLVDARGTEHYSAGLTDAWPDSGDDIVGPSEQDLELGPDEKEASTAFFAVPPGTVPERLRLLSDLDYSSRGGEKEVTVDLTSDKRGAIPPEDYLHVYDDYSNQRAYKEAYRMLDPSSTRGITLEDWLGFHEPLWGKRYVSLDGLGRVSESPGRVAFEMDRTFYDANGRPMPDTETNADATQEMVRRGEEWKLVMHRGPTQGILPTQDTSTASPQPTTPER